MESCFTNHQEPLDPLRFKSFLAKPAAFSRVAKGCADAMSLAPQSIAALFESEESPLLYYAIGIVRRRIVAEEIVQEAFLRLQKVEEQVENPRGWLYRSVRNLALNHLRDSREETGLDPEGTPAEETLPSDVLARNEAIGTMRMLLAEMPEDDRTLIKLKYDDNLRYQEISKRTGMSVGNVGFKLHHVLKGLLDGLQRAGIDGSQG
jgi:RNA polymerase sigma factor (sigma-70 family)